jgi:hypothetical protein
MDAMNADLINKITNWIAIAIVVLGSINTYLTSGETFNWFSLIMTVLTALVAYFTGKSTLNDQKKRNE